MLTGHGRFADPFFGRLVPDQRDQRGGEDEFEQEVEEKAIGYGVVSYQGYWIADSQSVSPRMTQMKRRSEGKGIHRKRLTLERAGAGG